MNLHAELHARIFTNPAWMHNAPCAGATDLFYAPDNHGGSGGDSRWVAKAKAICNQCPNRVRCLEYAIDNSEQFGVWGGLSVRERRAVAARRRDMGWTTGRHTNTPRTGAA